MGKYERRTIVSRLIVAAGGLLLHVMLLLSIFDIYFRSPIVHNVEPHQTKHSPLARRLVLFSVDGLRAESFLEHQHTPFLRYIAQNHGIWGISNTRVPTESRPGHVAMIAGFYEDPSAVTRGWKKNPVDFDSVFNQSRFTWSWGADDILEIFSGKVNKGRIFTFAYNTEDQTFSTDKNTTLLDHWVFARVQEFLKNATDHSEILEKLHSDKVILFLHLLGMDTAGHTHKPGNPDFITNLKYVDEGIDQMVKLIESFYENDGHTAYLMTSDHGMTNWGSHGASDKHETETPYVIWGAGVAQRIPNSDEGFVFGLPNNKRNDISQADLAPLMSTILSIPVPVNSIGKLPIDLLNMTTENKAKALYSNSLQLASQYNALRNQVEQNAIRVLYYPYKPFTRSRYNEILAYAKNLLAYEEFDKLTLISKEIMELSLSGLSYYHNYYQQVLLVFTSLSFVGWIALLLTLLMEQNTEPAFGVRSTKTRGEAAQKWKLKALFRFLALGITSVIYVQKLPVQYYLYCVVPIVLWWRVTSSYLVWFLTILDFVKQNSTFSLILQTVSYTMGTVAMVWSFSERWWLNVPLVGMAVWPFIATERKKLDWSLLMCWAVSCLLLGVFSFLPVVGKNTHTELVIIAGLIWVVAAMYFLRNILLPLRRSGLETKKEVLVLVLQGFLLLVALHNIFVQSKRFVDGTPVNFGYQTIAWVTSVLSLTLPILSSDRQACRLFSINTALFTFYLLLSVSHEGLFLLTLILNQICWLIIEFKLSNIYKRKFVDFRFVAVESDSQQGLLSMERNLTSQDFRRAFFFLLYIILSFFGTGNIASINSFEVRWVTCFITTFRPFIITALILCKTMVPFLIVTCNFKAINIFTKAPTGYLIVVVLMFSDMMGVQFLHLVKNTGSWLEIGTTISQYVISQVITVFIVFLHVIAKVLTEKSFTRFVIVARKKNV